jgi:hypothetical protein
MEWLETKILSGAVAIIVAWHWYDKKARDERFDKLEIRMGNAEAQSSRQQTQLEVMNAELHAFSRMTDVRLGHIQHGMDKLVNLFEKQSEKPNE